MAFSRESFYAGTRAGMAHAHLLLTWFNANSNAANAPSAPRPSKRSLVQTAILALKKKLRDSKRFPNRNHSSCFNVSEMLSKAPRLSSTLLPPPREQLCNRSCSNKTHTPQTLSALLSALRIALYILAQATPPLSTGFVAGSRTTN